LSALGTHSYRCPTALEPNQGTLKSGGSNLGRKWGELLATRSQVAAIAVSEGHTRRTDFFKGFEQLLELAKTLEEKAEKGELKTDVRINSRGFSSTSSPGQYPH
jgi:hypothetical protein